MVREAPYEVDRQRKLWQSCETALLLLIAYQHSC